MYVDKKVIGNTESSKRLIWLHGWGATYRSFLPLTEFFKDFENVLLDFPGFGGSSSPELAWNTEDYAYFLKDFAESFSSKETFLIGHSFGCRVALRYAFLFPEEIRGMVLISAAGLKKERSFLWKTKLNILKKVGRTAGVIDNIFNTTLKEQYSNKFGSSDYKNTKGVMRNVFVKTVNEDLSEIAPNINTKTLFLYGEKDNETPPSFGERYQEMMPNSKNKILENCNHWDILSDWIPVKNQVREFIKTFDEKVL